MPQVVVGAIALGGAALAAGGIGAALAAAGWVGFFANFGATLLLSAAVQEMAPRHGPGGIRSRDLTVRHPAASREMVYGRVRKGGVIIFIETSGDNGGHGSRYLHLVIALAGHQVEAIDQIYFDGDVAFDDRGVAQGKFAAKAHVEKHLGGVGGAPFAGLRNWLGSKWTRDHRLDGVAALYVRLTWDSDVFPGGIPNITAILRGRNTIHDPRTGTSGYSQNAALCIADYLADATFGMGAGIGAAGGIDADALIAAANVCDEKVSRQGQDRQSRYCLDGVIDTSQSPQTVIKAMLTAMAGQAIRRSGRWFIHPGAWRTPVLDITDDDAAGNVALTTRLSRGDNFNAVRGTFVSPENDWQVDDFPALTSDVYLAEDNGIRSWKDIALPFTTSASAAQRIARIELEQARRQMSVHWPGKLRLMQAATGDVVTLTRARWGFDKKPFVVVGMDFEASIDTGLTPVLRLAETSPRLYDWDASEEQIYAAAPRSNLPGARDIAAPGILSIDEDLYVTRQNAVKARATVRWSQSASAGVARYWLEGSLEGAEYVHLADTVNLYATLDDMAPGNWTFRLCAISLLGARSPWVTYAREIYGLGAAPSALTGATIQAAGGLAILKWDMPVDLDVRMGGAIVIRHSTLGAPTWAASRSLDEVNGNQTISVVPLMEGTYILRPRDSSGNSGPETRLYGSGAQVIAMSGIGVLREDDEFSGTHHGTISVGSELTLDVEGSFDAVADFDALANVDFLGNHHELPMGTYDFATQLDFGSVKTVRLRSIVEMDVLRINDVFDVRALDVDALDDWDGTNEAEAWCDCQVDIRTSDDGSAWSDWTRVHSTEVRTRHVKARATLSTTNTDYAPMVSRLRLQSDEATA